MRLSYSAAILRPISLQNVADGMIFWPKFAERKIIYLKSGDSLAKVLGA